MIAKMVNTIVVVGIVLLLVNSVEADIYSGLVWSHNFSGEGNTSPDRWEDNTAYSCGSRSFGYDEARDVNGWSGATLSLWVYSAGYPTQYNNGVIIDCIKYGASDKSGYQLAMDTTGLLTVKWLNGNSQNNSFSCTGGILALNRWYLVTIVYQGESLRMFLGEQLVAIDSSGVTSGSNNANANTSICLHNAGTRPFSGRIDDIKLWNRALTEDEISFLLHATSEPLPTPTPTPTNPPFTPTPTPTPTPISGPTEGLIYYSSMDENVALDQSGLNNHGSAVGGLYPAQDALGNSGHACYFDGQSGHIVLPDNLLDLLDSGTINAWIKQNEIGGMTIFSSGDENTGSQYAAWGVGTAGNLKFEIWSDRLYSTSTIYNEIRAGEWTMITVTTNGTDQTKLFINGLEKTSTGGSIGIWFDNIANQSELVTIGSNRKGGNNISFFGGVIDDFRIYNRQLSVTEIQELYTLFRTFIFIEMCSIPDSPSPVVAILGISNLAIPTVQIKNVESEAIIDVIEFFDQNWTPKSITALPDMNSNGSVEIAVMAGNKIDYTLTRTEIRDSQTKELLKTLNFTN